MAQAHSNLKLIPFAKLLAVVFALLGMGAGLIYSLGGLVYDLISTGSLNPGTALAFLAVFGMPVLFGSAGLLLGLIGGWLYNHLPKSLVPFQLDIKLLED